MDASPHNERLRSAIAVCNLTVEDVAADVGVDPKTVERWLAQGRVPHPRHRRALANLLAQPETFLWPSIRSSSKAAAETRAELVSVYSQRSDVPADVWPAFFDRARDEIGVLAYAALFLVEQYPSLTDQLARKAANGCRVRIALGDPDSEAVQARGREEQYGEGIESRARMALRHYMPLLEEHNVEVRLHGTTLYNSIYRSDHELLVNHHVWGANAYATPVLHIRRLSPGGLFDIYAQSFESVWSLASPVST